MPTFSERSFDKLRGMEPVSPHLRSDPLDAVWFGRRIEDLLTSVTAIFAALRQQMGMRPQALEIVIAEDVAAAVQALAGNVIGVEASEDFVTERVGGIVVGKTMFRDAAHEDAVVVLDSTVFRSDAAVARVGEIQITAHELAHSLIGQLRAAGRRPMEPTSLPWEVSRWLARYAIEEFLADSVAEVVLGLTGTAALDDGSTRPLTSSDFGECAETFLSAVEETFATVVSTIHDYRLGRIDLEAMWLMVQPKTSEMMISLAHAQAERDHLSDGGRDCVTSGLAAPLDHAWRAVCDCLEIPLSDGPEHFARAEQEAIDRAGSVIVELWRHLGLTFRPEGESFYISVAPPENAWPMKRPE